VGEKARRMEPMVNEGLVVMILVGIKRQLVVMSTRKLSILQ